MATVTDLPFDAINAEAIADANIGQAIFSFAGGAISLDISKLTGDTYTATSNEGFVEAMYKLSRLATLAQETVNAAVATTPAEELTSFPPSSFSLPDANGDVEITYSGTYQIKLDPNNVIGTN